jgi:ligand-binding SRPBCC domain-containing protein
MDRSRMCFRFETIIPVFRETVFAFHENPEHLELLHTGWSKIRLLSHERKVVIGAETWIEMTLAGCLPMVFGFRHTLFEPPVRFGEQAIHGPFTLFKHIHEFEELPGGTLVRDLIEVRLPWQYGAETIVARVVAPCITRMFHKRSRALGRLAREGTITRSAARHNL